MNLMRCKTTETEITDAKLRNYRTEFAGKGVISMIKSHMWKKRCRYSYIYNCDYCINYYSLFQTYNKYINEYGRSMKNGSVGKYKRDRLATTQAVGSMMSRTKQFILCG